MHSTIHDLEIQLYQWCPRIVADLILYFSLISEARLVRHVQSHFPGKSRGELKEAIHGILIRLKLENVVRHWKCPLPHISTENEPSLVVTFPKSSSSRAASGTIGATLRRFLGHEVPPHAITDINTHDLTSRLADLTSNAALRWREAVRNSKPMTVYAAHLGAKGWLLSRDDRDLLDLEIDALEQLDEPKIAKDPVGAVEADRTYTFDQPRERFSCGLPVIGELGITDLFLRWIHRDEQGVRRGWRGRLAYDHTYLKAHGDYHALLHVDAEESSRFMICFDEAIRCQFLILVHVSTTNVDFLQEFLANAQRQEWCAGVCFFINDKLSEHPVGSRPPGHDGSRPSG